MNQVLPSEKEEQVLVIPRHLINEKVLQGLGMRNLIKNAKKFKFENKAFNSGLEILVPQQATTMFVFNTTDTLNLPTDRTKSEYTKFISQSFPFSVPTHSALTDYYLMVPFTEKFSALPKQVRDDILLYNQYELPLFKHEMHHLRQMPESSALMVFQFQSSNKPLENCSPLLKVKSYLATEAMKSFFDYFAKSWLSTVDYMHLFHSVFCTVNVSNSKNSYCLRIKDDNTSLSLFPAYNGLLDEKVKRDTIDPNFHLELFSHLFETKTKRSTYPELILPLSLLQDPPVSNPVPRSKEYTQSLDLSTPTKVKREIARVSSKVDRVPSFLEQKYKTPLSKFISKEEIKQEANDAARKLTSDSQVKFKTDIKKSRKEKKKKLAIKQKKIQETKDLGTQKVSEPIADCQPVTWFNVFHHSVFGKPQFCGMKHG